MKEIKCKIVSQCETYDGLYKIEVKPLELVYGPLNCGKTYKLVEDESVEMNYHVAELNPNTIKYLKDVVEKTLDIKAEWIKANPNAFKFTPQFSFIYGGRSGGKTATQTELYKQFLDQLKTVNDLQESVTIKRVMFNGNATILEIGDFKTVVKCHEGDVFSYIVGLGLALSRYYEKQPSTRKEIKCLKARMKYNDLAAYCLEKYFNFDANRLLKFFKNRKDNVWCDLCPEK